MLSVQQIAYLAWEPAAPLCFNCEEFILCCLSLQSKHVDFGNVWFWMVSSKWYLLHMEQFWGVTDGAAAGAGGGLGKRGDLGRDGFEGTQSQMKTRPGEKERTEEEGERWQDLVVAGYGRVPICRAPSLDVATLAWMHMWKSLLRWNSKLVVVWSCLQQ